MGLVFRKTRKLKKSKLRARKQTSRKNYKRQSGGTPIGSNPISNPKPRMIINYQDDNNPNGIQIVAGQPDIDLTNEYNSTKILSKEPAVDLQGLESGKKYLLTMTDPDAMGKTWTHWVALLDSYGTITRQIAEYSGPSPPPASGIHHYIFQLYDASTLSKLPSTLDRMSRGDYFAIRLKSIVNGKPILAKAVFTIDSSKIKKDRKIGGVGNAIRIGLDALKAFAA